MAAKLKAEARRSGRSFRDIVNDTICRGLVSRRGGPPRQPFKVVTRDLDTLLPGLSLDSIADLVEQVEGPFHR